MDSRYRKFLALAESGSFSAAARSLHVTQPAITLAIASLEHALGVRLYVRRSRPILLTPEGQIVVDTARRMTAEHTRMVTMLQKGTPPDRIRIGLIDSIAHLLYASDDERRFLSGADVMVDNSRRILSDIRKGRIDLGVITGQPVALGAGMVVHKLHDEEFLFVAAPERVGSYAIHEIDDWLATNPGSTTYKHFLKLFKREHLSVTPIFHSASMELLRDMAIAGKGTALLPGHIVEAALKTGTLAVVQTGPVTRPIWLVTQAYPAEVLAAFAQRLNGLLG
jgi:DNA-binding transcriptional LysR family regulator